VTQLRKREDCDAIMILWILPSFGELHKRWGHSILVGKALASLFLVLTQIELLFLDHRYGPTILNRLSSGTVDACFATRLEQGLCSYQTLIM
jgi:hypothetical protein